jgi:lantibiotic modifying enzyme
MDDGWRPLLSGSLAARAVTIARQVADATARGEGRPPGGLSPDKEAIWWSGLSAGRAGHSLLHAYLAFHGAGDRYGETAVELLDRATDALAEVRMTETLYSGFLGISWVAQHLSGRLFAEDEDNGREIDETLLGVLAQGTWRFDYDLINGLAGFGVYALERLPHPEAVRCLEAVIARLGERALFTPGGAAFLSSPEAVPPIQRERYPHGAYNLGMAHGLPGIVALLGAACHAGIAVPEARRLLEATVSWLLARELPAVGDFRFPHLFWPGVQPVRCRLAWCYGDLGIATALLMAARGAGEPAWESAATRIALAAAERPLETSGVHDAGLCHGSAGVAHLFNRLYQALGEPRLGEAAAFWLRHTISFQQPGLGVGGYPSWSPNLDEEIEWQWDPGFLEGATGVALALLAAASPVAPEWDRLLLVSLPRSGAGAAD